uniref:Microseminoprotein beta n=1 Tax=Microcebus murinus TaxID=30608 RepID=A0A8C5XSU3_MICMU
MNALLGSLLAFATFVTLCNAECRVIPREGTVGASSSVFPNPIMMKRSARKSSTRITAALPWWRRRTQKRPVLSKHG